MLVGGVALTALLACASAAADVAGFHAPSIAGGSGATALALLGMLSLVAGLCLACRRAVPEIALHRRLTQAAASAPRLPGRDDVVLVPAARAFAFCGGLWRPRVYVSEGALRALAESELEAVLLHEHHHVRRRDPLRRLVLRGLRDVLFFVPLLGWLTQRFELLTEVEADRAAAPADSGRRALAAALLVFSDPLAGSGVSAGRVDELLGLPTSERPPRRSLVLSASVISSLVATGALLATTTGHLAG